MAIQILTIAGVAVLSAAACSSTGTTGSGKARLSAANMCKAAGGTYSGTTCIPGKNPITAQEICAAHNGTYISGGDYCEFDSGVSWKP